MPVHLPFDLGSCRSIADALSAYERQAVLEPEERDVYELAQTIDTAQLAVERLLKHVVSQSDELLLVASLNQDILKTLHKARKHRGVKSIFQTGVRFNTIDALPAAKLIAEVTHPEVAGAEYDAFVEALQSIVTLRNHVQHGTLFGDTDYLLGEVKRLLSELHHLITSLCPELFAVLRQIDGQAEHRLKALKEEMDAAWAVLAAYLGEVKQIEVPVGIYITLPGPDSSLDVILTGPTIGGGEDSLSLAAVVPAGGAVGIFAKALTPERVHAALMTAAIQKAAAEKFSLLSLSPPSSSSLGPLAGGYAAALTAPPATSRDEPIVAAEDGLLEFGGGSGFLWLQLKNVTKRRQLVVKVRPDSWRIRVKQGQADCEVRGILLPSAASDRQVPHVRVTGKVHLAGEYLFEEAREEIGIPAGGTWRVLKGSLELRLDT